MRWRAEIDTELQSLRPFLGLVHECFHRLERTRIIYYNQHANLPSSGYCFESLRTMRRLSRYFRCQQCFMQAEHCVSIVLGIFANVATSYRSGPRRQAVHDHQRLGHEIDILDRFLQYTHIRVRPSTWIERDNYPNRPLRNASLPLDPNLKYWKAETAIKETYNRVD